MPSLLALGEAYVVMSWRVVAFVCWSLSFPELLNRHIWSVSRSTMTSSSADGISEDDLEGKYLEVLLVAVSLMLVLTFGVAVLVARRHGTRASRPQISGYELANQDDLNQEL